MKHFILLLVLQFTLLSGPIFSQGLSQTVRGTITDADSQTPLIGVTVLVSGTNHQKGTTTDQNGSFRLDNVPAGRVTLQLSYIGYEPKAIPEIVVNSGKEVILNMSMQ